jgi:5-methylthioribose kinase
MFIDQQTPLSEIENLLRSKGFLSNNEEYITNVSKPGEGNMNVVLRIKTNFRSFIVKQSRPFVQKYQDINAPIERIDVEYQFYDAIAGNDLLNQHVPKILYYNAEDYLLILEDLGDCDDMSSLYDAKELDEGQLELLVNIAANIHNSKAPNNYPENKSLRKLNHQHIFVLPFMKENGFSLDDVQDGLQDLSIRYKNDDKLKETIKAVGDKYLSNGDTLLHGDYYPGSWMSKDNHIYVIDPEFSFKGFPEFDLAVLAAHAILITDDTNTLSKIVGIYPHKLNTQLLTQLAGIEIMRRLIGLAQLPLERSLDQKEHLLNVASNLILNK